MSEYTSSTNTCWLEGPGFSFLWEARKNDDWSCKELRHGQGIGSGCMELILVYDSHSVYSINSDKETMVSTGRSVIANAKSKNQTRPFFDLASNLLSQLS